MIKTALYCVLILATFGGAGVVAVEARAESAPPAQPGAAGSPDPAGLSIAHSALLAVDGSSDDGKLNLHIRRVKDQSLVSGDDVTVTVDGKSEPITRAGEAYQIAAASVQGGSAHDIEILVGHDGIREVLSGKVSLPETSSAGSLLRDHKQVAWWILNIVIVLIAAIAISRRKG